MSLRPSGDGGRVWLGGHLGFEPRVAWTCRLKAFVAWRGEIQGEKSGYFAGAGGNNRSAGEPLKELWTSICWA